MSTDLKLKFTLLSHILPPSPSGQAMVLHRLLNKLSPDRYCLISREKYNRREHNRPDSSGLAAKHVALVPAFQLPVIHRFKLAALCIIVNSLLEIYGRAKQIEKIVRSEQSRLLIACTGDLYDLPAAYLASKWAKVPLALYFFDDYVYQWTGINRSISKRLAPYVIRHAKGIIVPNEYLQKEYLHRFGVDSTVIHNPCRLPNLNELDKADPIFDKNEINMVYTGSVYHAHYDAFHNLLAAILHLNRSDVKLHLFTAQPESALAQNGISGPMVVYHPHINQTEVPNVLRQADILFLPLAFETTIPEVIKTSAPGKTGEYLAAGRPILVHAPSDSFVSWYFKHNKCGIVVDENDSNVLFSALYNLISDNYAEEQYSRTARETAERDFAVEQMNIRFVNFLNHLYREYGQ